MYYLVLIVFFFNKINLLKYNILLFFILDKNNYECKHNKYYLYTLKTKYKKLDLDVI